jgi:Phosphoesterase family
MKRMISFPTPIQHIVVVVMENRTVDNLFAAYWGLSFPNPAYPTWDQAMNLYDPYVVPTLEPVSLAANIGPNHSHGGLSKKHLGGFVNEVLSWNNESFGCHHSVCSQTPTAYSMVPTTDTAPYASLVYSWASANNVYQSNEGPSFPAHQYLIAGQTGGAPNAMSSPYAEAENDGCNSCNPPPTPPPDTLIYAEDNPQGDSEDAGGCYPPGATTHSLNMALGYSQNERSQPVISACEEYGLNNNATILDEAASIGVPPYYDWQYIAPSEGSFWAAPMGVNHLYQAYTNGNPATQPFAIDGDAINFVSNLYSPNPQRPFAALTFIAPCFSESDHPNSLSITGPLWLGWLINAIGETPYWPNTTIIVTWDDWGGWFDHMPSNPPLHPFPNTYNNAADPNEWGFRVPLLVISPYVTSRAYVSQPTTQNGVPYRSQSAILQYIEATFNLPTLYTDDFYQNQVGGLPTDFLKDMVNYDNAPLAYQPVPVGTYSPTPCH